MYVWMSEIMNTTDKTTRFCFPVAVEAAMLLLPLDSCGKTTPFGGLVRACIVRSVSILWTWQQFHDVTSAANEVQISKGSNKRGSDSRECTV